MVYGCLWRCRYNYRTHLIRGPQITWKNQVNCCRSMQPGMKTVVNLGSYSLMVMVSCVDSSEFAIEPMQ